MPPFLSPFLLPSLSPRRSAPSALLVSPCPSLFPACLSPVRPSSLFPTYRPLPARLCLFPLVPAFLCLIQVLFAIIRSLLSSLRPALPFLLTSLLCMLLWYFFSLVSPLLFSFPLPYLSSFLPSLPFLSSTITFRSFPILSSPFSLLLSSSHLLFSPVFPSLPSFL